MWIKLTIQILESLLCLGLSILLMSAIKRGVRNQGAERDLNDISIYIFKIPA